MKINKILLTAAAALVALASCKDDGKEPGDPVLEPQAEFTGAYFADSLAFSVRVSDSKVPLSTLRAQLYFSDEMVSETVIRTRTNGEYSDKLFVPYHANIPNGEATLKFVLQNINFTSVEKSYTFPVSRPDYPSLTLAMEDGTKKAMTRTSLYNYEVEDSFDAKVKAYIVAPAYGSSGNEMSFGMSGGAITQGVTSWIAFSEAQAGNYAIRFNTLTYEASPFVIVKINGAELMPVDDNNSAVTMTVAKGAGMTFEGIADIGDWWMNPAWFEPDGEGYRFRAMDGSYRITANFAQKYFIVQTLNASGSLATLNADGTGALWIIGDDIGFPNLSSGNEVGWTTEKGICMAPIESRKYRVILLATDKSVNPALGTVHSKAINFKFFHQQGWGGEFQGTGGSNLISTESTVVTVTDAGNLSLAAGVALTEGKSYVFTVDVASNSSAVLTVEEL